MRKRKSLINKMQIIVHKKKRKSLAVTVMMNHESSTEEYGAANLQFVDWEVLIHSLNRRPDRSRVRRDPCSAVVYFSNAAVRGWQAAWVPQEPGGSGAGF